MVNVVRFQSRSKAYEDAAAWVARIDRGLSAEERVALGSWLEDKRLHRRAFMDTVRLWDELDVLSELSGLFPLEQSRGASRAAPLRWAAAALAGVALAVGGWLAAQHVSSPFTRGPQQLEAFNDGYRTAIGERAVERLPDGSAITLNTDTEVDVDYSARRRDVFLRRGEANFEVAHDPGRPFDVHVGDRVVQAVGTAFNVRIGVAGGMEVTVTEGEVKLGIAPMPSPVAARRPDVSSQSREKSAPEPAARAALKVERPPVWDTTVAQGQVAVLDAAAMASEAAARVAQLQPADLDIKLAWQRGMLIFRGEPLETMLAEVGRYTTTQFVLEDPSLASIRVGGYFRAGDIEGLLAALRENFQIESETDGNRVLLRASRSAAPGPAGDTSSADQAGADSSSRARAGAESR